MVSEGTAPDAISRRAVPDWLALLGWIGVALTAGAIGGIASLDAGAFYQSLAKPAWAPPGWVFGPVWSALYVLMGIAAWLVWRMPSATYEVAGSRRRALTLFVAQLALNALWTWVFFAWKQTALAFGEIVLLWAAVAMTIRQFARLRPSAAWCLAPYLAWTSFAAALTWSIWQRNPGHL